MNTQTEKISDKSTLDGLLEDRLPELEQAAGRLADHVKAHPVPYTLVGAGLAILAVRAMTRRESPTQAAVHAVEKAGSRAREAIENLAERATEVKEKTVDAAARANRRATDFAEKNPLVVGVGIVAARFLAELLLKKQSPQHAAQSMSDGGDLRKNLREFLRSVLDEPV